MRTIALMVLTGAVALHAQQAGGQQPAQPAAGGPPATEIYLATLSVTAKGWSLGQPANISNSPGYDNQPFFTPDGKSLLFTSDRAPALDRVLLKQPARLSSLRTTEQVASGPPQTDIFRYDIASGQVSRVTATPESEYSPTVTPDGQGISVIRVERNQLQRLWRFTRDGRKPSLILEAIEPVGYHAWLDRETLALFVLGPPATLQIAGTKTGTAQVVTSDIGQSVLRIPSGGVSFVQQGAQGAVVSQVVVDAGRPVTKVLTPVVPGARQAHLAWTPDGTLVMFHNGWLHAWTSGDTAWRAVVDLEAFGLKSVTRLAVSPTGDRIAIVAQ